MSLSERIVNTVNKFTGSYLNLVAGIVGVIAFTALYFFMISFLMKNGAKRFTALFIITMILSALLFLTADNLSGIGYLLVPSVFLVVLVIIYTVEIKRMIWAHTNLKLADVKKGVGRSYDEEKVENCISEIIKALQNMSKNDVGAIIVLSTNNVPDQIIDSGVKLDSDISSALIESVFFPKTPLHDGAMIIGDTKIVAAGCFLPLSQSTNIPKDLGTRHRAGIGVTENIDVVSLIVSEETGIISIARGGQITRYADSEMLKKTLTNYYWTELEGLRK